MAKVEEAKRNYSPFALTVSAVVTENRHIFPTEQGSIHNPLIIV
jgi:hypothetical protein